MDTSIDNRYWVPVDAASPNNAHAFAIDLIGYGKRVLELGPAAGHVTRALVGRGCDVTGIEVDAQAAAGLEGVADCIVGDLTDPSVILKAAEQHGFDVVLAGDVLEHLPDPLPSLRACRRVLAPGGYLVISLPNVGHADIALSLLRGEFPYRDSGLLDRTHLRFFTLQSIMELLEQAGLLAIDIRRVVRPVFETELQLDPASFAPGVVETVLAHPEAETYQFVVRAVPHDGDLEVSRLAARTLEAYDQVRRDRSARLAAEAEIIVLRDAVKSADAELIMLRDAVKLAKAEVTVLRDAVKPAKAELAVARDAVKSAKADSERWRKEASVKTRKVEMLMASKTMRYTAPMRAVYRRVRSITR